MIKLVDLLKEVQLSSNEQAVIDDILSLDEAIDFSSVMDKVKSYVKKGLITATILASLLNNSAFSQEQKDQIKDAVKTEKQVDSDVISFKKLKKIVEDEGFRGQLGTLPFSYIKGVENVKIYRMTGNTEGGISKFIDAQIKLDNPPPSNQQTIVPPIVKYGYVKQTGNGYTVLVAVPVSVPSK